MVKPLLSSTALGALLVVISLVSGQESSSSECAAGTNGDGTCSSTPPPTSTNDQCGFYLAPSSIPGAGYGIYSAFSHPVGSTVGHPDILHVMTNRIQSILDNYEWDAPSLGTEFEGHSISNVAPGFGMLINGHYALDNVELLTPHWSDAGLHRSNSPAAGSFTLAHNLTSIVYQPIPAGAELFLNYGESYFKTRHEYRGKVFTKGQFAFADRLNTNMACFVDTHGAEVTDTVEGKMMQLVHDIMEDIPELSLSTKLVPKTCEEVKKVAKIGAARNQFPDSLRTLEWIKENGWCIDNLKADISSKPERGRGAFATRPIRKGEVVVASPLLYLFEEKLEFVIKNYNGSGSEATQKQKHLLTNYCFGHPESSLVLFPYSPLTNLINHDSTDANVELQWAADEKQPDFWKEGRRDKVYAAKEYMKNYGGSGLILEYIASKDIEEDEEVLLNYGDAWEQAWNKHVAEWSAPPDSETYVEAFTLTQAEANNVVRTIEEQEDEPYPSNVMTACYVEWYRDYDDLEDIGEDDTQDSTVEVVFAWDEGDDGLYIGHHYLRPCKILERKGDLYSVQLLNKISQPKLERVEDFERVIATGVPRKAIVFANKIYSTDHYLESAFRHTIGGMDDLWPPEWKDRSASDDIDVQAQ